MNQINRRRAIYLASDYATTNVGWLVFNILRYYSLPVSYSQVTLTEWLLWPQPLLGQIIIPLMMLGFYWLSGYYNSSNIMFKSRLEELLNTLMVTFAGTLAIFFVTLINDDIPERMRYYELVGLLYASLFIPVYICRVTITSIHAHKVRRGDVAVNAFVVGTTRAAVDLANRIHRPGKRTGMRVVGFVATDPSETTISDLGLPVYTMDQLAEAAQENNVHSLIVMPHRSGMHRTVELLGKLYPLGLGLFITPDLYHLITMRPRMSAITGEPLVDITAAGVPPATVNAKRVGDVVASIFALILLSPLLAAIAVAIKRSSKGPVFYLQERIGYHKRPFNIIKFRTMYVDAESSGPMLSSLDDPRITKIGRFLRKYRLDELPQFWNVVKGDMSLIGPRPEREYYIKQIVERAPYYCLIHQVRPGITSWGMVKFGYASNVDEMIERLRYDLLYIENVSLGVDMKILLHTINTVLTGRGV